VHVVRRRSVVRRSVMRRRSGNVVRRSRVVRRSGVVRRSSMVVRTRRLSLSVYRGRLRGATWLLLLFCPHGKRIGF
jgi:hypothetical protein